MKLFNKWFAKLSTLKSPERWLLDGLGIRQTAAGVHVNETNAIRLSAVYACVRVLSESIASLPLNVYKRTDSGKDRAYNHHLHTVLHDMANEEMTSFEFREMMMAHLLLWGNAYAEIERDMVGDVVGLWPLRPDQTIVDRDESERIIYRYTRDDGQEIIYPFSKVLHIKGLSPDGLVGYSPIRLAREPIGVGLAAEDFTSRFYGQGMNIGGILEHPEALSERAYERLKAWIEEKGTGLANSWRPLVLEEGMKYSRIPMPLADAQYLETRKFQVSEIARIYRVPPHLIGDLDRSTNNNIEHQSLEFVVHTLRPWLVRWEQAIKQKLFTTRERKRYYAEFVVDGLLRGDIKSRYQAYAVGRQWGWLSADDIREKENMNDLPDGQGKTYLTPLNMIDSAEKEPEQD